jgi:hypothetical protein
MESEKQYAHLRLYPIVFSIASQLLLAKKGDPHA